MSGAREAYNPLLRSLNPDESGNRWRSQLHFLTFPTESAKDLACTCREPSSAMVRVYERIANTAAHIGANSKEATPDCPRRLDVPVKSTAHPTQLNHSQMLWT